MLTNMFALCKCLFVCFFCQQSKSRTNVVQIIPVIAAVLHHSLAEPFTDSLVLYILSARDVTMHRESAKIDANA